MEQARTRRRVYVLDEDTQIPVRVVWVVVTALVSIAASFTTLLVKEANLESKLEDVAQHQVAVDIERTQRWDRVLDNLSDIRVDMAKVKQRLNIDTGK